MDRSDADRRCPVSPPAVVLGQGMGQLNALLIPSLLGEAWLMELPRADILAWLEQVCGDAPPYAVPKNFVVCPAGRRNKWAFSPPMGASRAAPR